MLYTDRPNNSYSSFDMESDYLILPQNMKFLEYMANAIINCVKVELNNYKGPHLMARQAGLSSVIYPINSGLLLFLTCNNRMVFIVAVLVLETPPRYFAKEMVKADELKILRIMVSRSEVSSAI